MLRLVLLVLHFVASITTPPATPSGDIGGGWDPNGGH
jgi:hypothetical protein